MVPVGTIDADYRGEVFVTMHVVGSRPPHVIKHGDRIAQLVIGQLVSSVLVETNELSSTERGSDGHGSTGR
jgi:dUTP pyrophosphatase